MSYEYDSYINTVDVIEDRIEDDNKYPVVENNKVKKCCHITLEFTKIVLKYFKLKVDANKKKKSIERKPIPEDFELSDDEPTTVNLNEEQRVSSKFITFDCPICKGKLQLRNEIEINPKGIKCKCNPCSFKISKNDKTMNVSRDDNGDIKLDSQDHSISFSFNRRQITPESEDEKTRNQMIADVMNSTPRNYQQSSMGEMD